MALPAKSPLTLLASVEAAGGDLDALRKLIGDDKAQLNERLRALGFKPGDRLRISQALTDSVAAPDQAPPRRAAAAAPPGGPANWTLDLTDMSDVGGGAAGC